MIVTCKNCNTGFNLEESFLKPTGSKVRCSLCKEIFVAYPPSFANIPDKIIDINHDKENISKEDGSNSGKDNYKEKDPENEKFYAATESEDLDLSLDIDFDQSEKSVPDPEDAAKVSVESVENKLKDSELVIKEPDVEKNPGELALDLDLDLHMEEKEPANKKFDVETESENLELSLDVDFDQSKKSVPDPEDAAKVSVESVENKLKDSELVIKEPDVEKNPGELALDLDLDLHMEEKEPANKKFDVETESENLELSLDVDFDQSKKSSEESVLEAGDENEFDLSDLEDILDVEDGFETEDASEEDTCDIDLELDSDSDEDFDMVIEESDSKVEYEPTQAIDLSDLKNILDVEDGFETEDASEKDTCDIDLELDSDSDKDFDMVIEESDSEVGHEPTQPIDLSDLENILDVEDGFETEDASEEDTCDIDLELDSDSDEDFDMVIEESDSEVGHEPTQAIDLSEIEGMLAGEDEEPEAEDVSDNEAGDLELQLEFDPVTGEDSLEPESDFDDDENELSAQNEREETANQKNLPAFVEQPKIIEETISNDNNAKPMRRKKIRKTLMILAVLVLLSGGTYYTLASLDNKGIKIPLINDFARTGITDLIDKVKSLPFIDKIFKSKTDDFVGNLKIIPIENTITGNYVKNSKEGMLFVISGKVKNEYDYNRSHISVKGNLFTKDGACVNTQTVYCGNELSSLDLENLDFNNIIQRLNQQDGNNKSNINIKPGTIESFMIVFNKLPKDIEMFNVEVAGSVR